MINPMVILTNPVQSVVYMNDFHLSSYEEWKLITDIAVPNILPYYYISNMGRVYSTYTNKILTPSISTTSNYYTVAFATYDGNYLRRLIHRIEMILFNYVDNHNELMVNHKDCDKTNNRLWNLEWCTAKENIGHAIRNNLISRVYGEDTTAATITEEQVHIICQMLEKQKYSHEEISNYIGCGAMAVSHIAAGNSWNHITKQYNLEKRKSLVFTNNEFDNIVDYIKIHMNDEKPKHQIIKDTLYYIGLKYNKSMYDGVNYILKRCKSGKL